MKVCKVEITQPNQGTVKNALVKIDGMSIPCRYYRITHGLDSVPMIELDVLALPKIVHECRVGISNKEDIARLMDLDEFTEFCGVWKRIWESEGGFLHEDRVKGAAMDQGQI